MRFGLLGAAGYIAPRHAKAIVAAGGQLVAACDPHDAVGHLDAVALGCYFTSSSEDFWRLCRSQEVDTVVITTPNILHSIHASTALKCGFNVVLEKPPTLSVESARPLMELAASKRLRIWPVLQCRLHPAAQSFLLTDLTSLDINCYYKVIRGPWYDQSWKAHPAQGGLETNIGIHLMDLLCVKMGGCPDRVSVQSRKTRRSIFKLEWRSGITATVIIEIASEGEARFDISNGDNTYHLSGAPTLHHVVYRNILHGKWYELDASLDAIATCSMIRNTAVGK